MKNKKFILLGIIICLFIVSLVVFIVKNNSINKEVLKKQVVHDITFDKVSITKKNNKYIFKVTLTSKKDVKAESFDANFKNKKGESIEILSGYIGNISSDETKIIEIETDKKINKAYDLTYTVYNE